MGLSEIDDVNVIANASAVGRRVIGAENFDVRFLAERNFQNIGDDVRLLPVVFAEFLTATGGIEVPEANISETVLPVIPTQNALEHELRFAVGINRLFRQVLGNWHFFRNTKNRTGGRENKFSDTSLNAGFQEIDAVGDVVAEILTRIGHAFRYKRVGGKVHDGFRSDFFH